MKQISMKQSSLFFSMAPLSWCSIVFFVFAKISGMIGVCLGFLGAEYHYVGGIVLTSAIISIFCSIFCSIIQTIKDKKKFEDEDIEHNKIKSLAKIKLDLEQEIKKLEEQKISLENLKFRKRLRHYL